MDFWGLPPEINSTRIWTGPGSAPLLAAAAAWGTLSQGLYSTAAEVTAAIGAIPWTGPSANLMRAAVLRYTVWLTTTAAQAETTATQAHTAASSFETARAATVHPALVAANRTQTAALIATNLLGQNTPTIAALEAQYMQMWAQDIAAMSAYLAASQANTLPPFTPAPQTGNPSTPTPPTTSPGVAQQVLSLLNPNSVPLLGLDNGTILGQYLQAFLSSGPYEIPLAILSLFSSMWALSSPISPITQALTRLTAEANASAPSVANATSTVRAVMGTAQRPAGLSMPRVDWAQPPPQAPSRAPTVQPLTPEEQHTLPIPLPLPVSRGGTPMRQPRPEPEYGLKTVKFVPETC